MYKAIYLGPRDQKTVWHNHGSDADGSPYIFTRRIPLEIPDSLARVLNTAPNFRLADGTAFITDPQLKVMHDAGSPVSILLIRYLGGVGDILMVTPAIRGVREKFPCAEITFAINMEYLDGILYDVIEHNPHIDKFINSKSLSIEAKSRYSSWVDLSHPCARYEAFMIPDVDKHRTEIYCDECEVTPSSWKPEIYLTDEDEQFAMQFWSNHDLYDERVIAIQPLAADLRRTWGIDRTLSLAASMGEYTFLWVEYYNRLPENAPENIIDIGRVKIRQLSAIIKRCSAAVGCDSFMLQVATATNVPLVAIFGATNPYMRCKFHDNWEPVWNKDRCENCPCWYGYPCLNTRLKNLGNLIDVNHRDDMEQMAKRKCIESVTVEQVREALKTVLIRSGKA